jgi:hypothetical protein
MKALIWGLFALLALLWTGLVLVSAELTGWLATTVASGQAGDLAASAGQWPVPAWLALWVDPAWVEALQAGWVQLMGWLGASGPAIGSVVSWLIPLMWVVWGLVLLVMLLAAAAGHFLMGRFAQPAAQARLQT